jgi:hypothetical protein
MSDTRRSSRSGSRAHCSDETREKGASRASVAAARRKGVRGKKKKRQNTYGPTLDADAHIFQAASSFWTQEGALDAVSTARRPRAERWRRK